MRLVPTCEQRQPPKTYLLPAYYRLFVNAIIITAAKTTNGNITIIIIDRYLIDQVLSFILASPQLAYFFSSIPCFLTKHETLIDGGGEGDCGTKTNGGPTIGGIFFY